METRLYKKEGEVLTFQVIKLQRDRSVLEIWGIVGQEGEYKFNRFNDLPAGNDYFKKRVEELKQEYNYIPSIERFKVGIPLDLSLSEDELIELVMPYYDLIVETLLKTGNGEIGDGEIKDSHHLFEVHSVSRDLAIKSLKQNFSVLNRDKSVSFEVLWITP